MHPLVRFSVFVTMTVVTFILCLYATGWRPTESVPDIDDVDFSKYPQELPPYDQDKPENVNE